MAEVVHASPLPGRDKTPCCGKTPFEIPGSDRMTNDVAAVTCGYIEYATGRKDFTMYLHGGDEDLPFRLEEAFKREGFQVKKETMDLILAQGNPFYEVGIRCWLNVGTGRIGLDKLLP